MDVGVAEIARRAGVGTGTLFRHFPTKHDLLVAVMLDRTDDMRAVVLAAQQVEDPWQALVRIMSDSAELYARDRCFRSLKTSELMNDPVVQQVSNEVFSEFRRVVDRAHKAGVLRKDVEMEDLPQLMDAVTNVASQWYSVRPDLWRRYLTIVLDGLRPGGTALDVPPPTMDELYAGFGCAVAASAGACPDSASETSDASIARSASTAS